MKQTTSFGSRRYELYIFNSRGNPGLYVDEIQQKLFEAQDIDVSIATISHAIKRQAARGRTGRDRGHVGGGCIVQDGLRHAANNVNNVRKGDRNEETSSCSPL